MEDQQRESDRSGWDDIRPSTADRFVARQPTRRKAPSSLGWYHARWIAINIVLIAATAWLYLHFLIPRFLGTSQGGQHNVSIAISNADHVPTAVAPVTIDSVQRLRREPELTTEQKTFFARSKAAMDTKRFRCIDGLPFELIDDHDVTRIEQIGREVHATCGNQQPTE